MMTCPFCHQPRRPNHYAACPVLINALDPREEKAASPARAAQRWGALKTKPSRHAARRPAGPRRHRAHHKNDFPHWHP